MTSNMHAGSSVADSGRERTSADGAERDVPGEALTAAADDSAAGGARTDARSAAPGGPSAPPRPGDGTPSGPRRGPWKRFKQWVKRRLFAFCRWLEDTSVWIQKRIIGSTMTGERAAKHLAVPLDQMDRDLLGIYIRWNGHHVEKSVRYAKTEGRGHGKPVLLRRALDEWYRRGYPRSRWIEWAESNLDDYRKWDATGLPQIHSEKTLPQFGPESPVMQVLKNRVSTRFWKEVPVEDEKIRDVIEAGVYAPTCCNRQTWKLYVHKKTHVTAVADVSNRALRHKAPVAIYITIDNRLYPEFWAPAEDAGIIGLQLNLAATALGLGGCLMYGAENFNQAEFRRQYNVPEYRFMYLMFLFGYPAERTLTDKRLLGDEVAIFV